jgi:alkaline phosphatase D
MGSCAYINEPGTDREGGRPYGGDYQIFESIYEKSPDLMLWLGDNVYYRENEYESRTGMLRRWTADRALPELQPLLTQAIHYASWDDHDYGPNDIGRNYWLKGEATEVFTKMWGNPSAGLPETPGIFSFVNWGDVNLYILDNRTYLSPAESHPEAFDQPKAMLGKAQVDWLIDHLAWAQSQSINDGKSYPARFNVIMVGNQVLNNSGNPHGYRAFEEEWNYLMDRIVAEGITGVVFVSGDVHFGEVNRIEHQWLDKKLPILEVTSSPLTAGAWGGHSTNDARLDIFPGEMDRVGERNFVTLDFEGPLEDRRMVIRYWDSEGQLLNQKPDAAPGVPTDASIIRAAELRPGS